METSTLLVPQTYQHDIQHAVQVLKEAGCKEIFLFGSLVKGHCQVGSDIDLAVAGCPSGKFFSLLGQLMLELEHPVDLVSLDSQSELAEHLRQTGELVKID
ncbi:MAG TPA: nucleotidyltransferase domain-containing protein [Anaerolineae bacterium]|nr:nucleotidyltransferase domain-containing protein [Anaerolineae bacterium]